MTHHPSTELDPFELRTLAAAYRGLELSICDLRDCTAAALIIISDCMESSSQENGRHKILLTHEQLRAADFIMPRLANLATELFEAYYRAFEHGGEQ
jgi:hypothetical protein